VGALERFEMAVREAAADHVIECLRMIRNSGRMAPVMARRMGMVHERLRMRGEEAAHERINGK
jgi:hypothetical protein